MSSYTVTHGNISSINVEPSFTLTHVKAEQFMTCITQREQLSPTQGQVGIFIFNLYALYIWFESFCLN